MFKRWLILILFLFLIGCTTVKTETVYKSVYPNLPNIEYPSSLHLSFCKMDIVKDEQGNLISSNIFVWFSKDDYKCYLHNQEVIKKQIELYQGIIDEVNSQRKIWREKN